MPVVKLEDGAAGYVPSVTPRQLGFEKTLVAVWQASPAEIGVSLLLPCGADTHLGWHCTQEQAREIIRATYRSWQLISEEEWYSMFIHCYDPERYPLEEQS